jgi:hypothetical protein
MHMLGHHDGCVKVKARSVSVQAASKDSISTILRERKARSFAEGDENRSSLFLVMRKSAAILILGREHNRVARAFLPAIV